MRQSSISPQEIAQEMYRSLKPLTIFSHIYFGFCLIQDIQKISWVISLLYKIN